MSQYPDNVVDKAAYDEYQRLQAVLEITPSCYEEQHEGELLSVDFNCLPFHLTAKIGHLDESLQMMIRRKWSDYRSIMMKVTQAKLNAFNHKSTTKASTKNMLEPYKHRILQWFGEFHTIAEVHEKTVRGLKIDVSVETLQKFRTSHINEINELQEIHKRDHSSIRLVHKKSRLLELSSLYKRRKQVYDSTQHRDDYKLLLATLDYIRKEVDGDKIVIEGYIDVNIDVTVNAHVNQQLMSNLNLMDIILSRIAARTNSNPQFLMNRLTSSIYSKLTGFQYTQDRFQEQVPDVSSITYDFDKMRPIVEQKAIEAHEQKMIIVLPEKVQEHTMSAVDRLNALIKQKIATVNQHQDNLLNNE